MAVQDQTIEAMLAELGSWLKAHRADYYATLGKAATPEELRSIESLSGYPLPAGLRSLLLWRNGQSDENCASFHPLTNEMFMASSQMVHTMREMHDLVQGDIPKWAWKAHWVPFMDNGGGDLSAIDSKTGEIRLFEHEGPRVTVTHKSFIEWFGELLAELRTLRFESWDMVEVRGQ